MDAEGTARGLRADLATRRAGWIGGCCPPRRRGHPTRRLLEPLLRQATRPRGLGDRSDERVDRLLVQVVADAERVDAGRERLNAASSTPTPPLIARISSASVTTSPSKPSSSRRSPVMIRRLSVAGSSSRPGTTRCPRHHRLDACRDRGPERQQRSLEVARHDGEVEVRVDGRVAVPGEVLRAGGDALPLRPAHERRDVAGDELRVGAEAANADHRVVRVRVHVGDGREVHIHAGAHELARDRRRDLLGQLDVVDGAERQVPRVRAAALRFEPRDVAALLVDRDEDARRPPAAAPSAPPAARGRRRCRRRA